MLPEAESRTARGPGRAAFALRAILLAALVGTLAACAGGSGSSTGPVQGTQVRDTAPPGPAGDPWGPYIREASARFDVPEVWIRAVMQVESGGRTHINGKPTVSRAGAMGLMQVMPGTYEELRQRYGFGPDPFYPRDNIHAGTAYLREMYDRFGSPGFLAAYNAGPGRYGEYLTGDRGLPAETRNYVAMISPRIAGIHPRVPNGGTMLASAGAPRPAAALPVVPSPARPVIAASVQPVQMASLAPVVSPSAAAPRPAPAPVQVATAGDWAIQVGAFRSPNDSNRAIDAAQRTVPGLLTPARRHVMEVSTSSGQFYRARLVGFSSDQAQRACETLAASGTDCMTVSPNGQTS